MLDMHYGDLCSLIIEENVGPVMTLSFKYTLTGFRVVFDSVTSAKSCSWRLLLVS